MSDPKRWTATGSEVDPVLQSVMRYAQDLRPTPEQVSSIVERLTAPPPALAQRPSRAPMWKTLGAVALVAGAAAAAVAVRHSEGAPPRRVTEITPEPSVPRETSGVTVPERASPEPAGSSSEVPVSPPSPAPVLRGTSPQASTAAASDREGVSLLQEARRHVAGDPSATLALTRRHASEFPQSSLREERDALRIQALYRLRRTSEAEAALARFEKAYPSSPYRRKLRSERAAPP